MSLQLFKLGQLCITPGALDACTRAGVSPVYFVARHVRGDFGDLDREDNARNLRALQDGSRIFSMYILSGVKFYVITEADRSVTTTLLPHEY